MFNQFACNLIARCLILSGFLLLTGAATGGRALAQGGCTLACNSNVQVSLNQNGEANITVGLIAPYAASICPSNLQIVVYDPQNNPIPSLINCSRLNQTLPVRITDTSTGNVCFGSVIIKDYLPPVTICPDKYIQCNEDTSVVVVGKPVFTDNCTSPASLATSYSDLKLDLPCFTNVNGQTVTAKVERTWLVVDQSGNSSTCVEDIWLKRSTIADVTYPPNRDGFGGPFVTCEQDPYNLTLTGQPLVHGRPLLNGGDCELVANKTDQIVNVCQPAGFKIFRTWTVSDWCASTFTIHVQLIEVKDFTAPTIQAPANLTIGVQDTACVGVVTLPTPVTSDNCSAVTVTPNWAFGSGFGPFNQVPLGEHTVTFTARDVCNNTSTATSKVKVIDNKVPIAVCKGSVQVSLPSGGFTLLGAASLDNGSYDKCSAVSFSISRDSLHFALNDTISCADAGDTIKMYLKATDAALNENTCWSLVQIRDFQRPSITCPPSLTVNCLAAIGTAQTGMASASDNCGVQSLTHNDSTALSICNTGTIWRKWVAMDSSANASSCMQVITRVAVSNPVITFPADITVNACATQAAYATTATGTPSWTGQFCGQLTTSYLDEIVTVSPPACFTIYRRWKVYDDCIYNPNQPNSAGLWEKTQKISIFDNVGPAISPPPHITVSPDRPDCKADVVLAPASFVDCSNVTMTNNSLYASSNGPNASGVYPAGIHLVLFTATDACGNISIASTLVTVKDTKAPTALCNAGTIVQMNAQGIATVQTSAINAASYDNCTPAYALSMSVAPQTFTCQQLGAQSVVLSVTDQENNIGICQTYVLVQDNVNACAINTYVLGGGMIDYKGAKVNEVPVQIKSDAGSFTSYTNLQGQYIQTDLPELLNYTVKPRHNENVINGVNSLDVLLIQRHILGLAPLVSPFQQLAGDVNNTRSLTSSDIVELRRLILGAIDTFPKVNSWRFVPSIYTFPNPNNPFQQVVPDSVFVPQLSAHQLNIDFTAVKMGDVNGSANSADTRGGSDPELLSVQDAKFAEGEKLIIPIKLHNWKDWDAFQFALQLDTNLLVIDTVLYAKSALLGAQNIHKGSLSEGRVAVSWDNAILAPTDSDSLLMQLVVTAKAAGELAQAIHMPEDRWMRSEAYRLGEQDATPFELFFAPSANMALRQFQVLDPLPNPFTTHVTLQCRASQAVSAQLVISDLSGRTLTTLPWEMHKGLNTKLITRDLFPTNGIYFYTIRFDGFGGSFGNKLVLMGME